MLCTGCSAPQPPDAKADYFGVFGIERGYAVDVDDLERRYKDATKILHPDRFARADPRARRASLERSVQLNQAWRILRDPVRRAEYLLSLDGVTVGELSAVAGSTPSGGHVTVPVSQPLLMEILELREALAESRAVGDAARIRTLVANVRARLNNVMRDVAEGFAAATPESREIAARLITVRYYQRFLDEAQAALESQPEGEGHAG